MHLGSLVSFSTGLQVSIQFLEVANLAQDGCGKAGPWLSVLALPLPPLLPVHSLTPQTPAWTLPARSISQLEHTTELAVGYCNVNKWHSEQLYETR